MLGYKERGKEGAEGVGVWKTCIKEEKEMRLGLWREGLDIYRTWWF